MTTLTIAHQPSHRTEQRNLVRHFFEMVAAMLVGMAALGAVVQAICAALGHSEFFLDHVTLRAPLMAANMTIGMAFWMHHRHHSWHAITEMGAAMFVPLIVLIGPYWAGVLSGDALLGAMHVLMLPAMVIAMLRRRDEYAQDHRHHPVAPPQAPSVTTLDPSSP
jgi:hypothetical protein